MAKLVATEADLIEEFKQVATAMWKKLHSLNPSEQPYALLFEINDQNPNAWPIAATEESLARLAAKYDKKGYRAKNGNHLDVLRIAERWDAPGDQPDGWYWGDEQANAKLNRMLEQRFGDGYRDSDKGYRAIQKICLQGLKEVDAAGAFGEGSARDNLVIGISNVDRGFEAFLDEIAIVNPKPVIVRLQRQLKDGVAAWDELSRPGK
jgi:hypothetical protein